MSNRLVSHFYKSLFACDYIDMRTLLLLLLTIQINAQSLCDSLYYNIQTSQTLTLVSFNTSSDSVNFIWTACDNTTCYSESGDTVYFPLVNLLDTVKICYNISPQWTCDECADVVFNGSTWQLLNIIVHVNELQPARLNSKIYDLLGRELKRIPSSGIYIKNGILYK